MITKGSVCHKVLTGTKVYALHNRALSYVWQDWTHGRERRAEAQGACMRAGQHTDTGPRPAAPGALCTDRLTIKRKALPLRSRELPLRSGERGQLGSPLLLAACRGALGGEFGCKSHVVSSC